ncbi:hypothetical protein [Caproicibacter sp.]|uniref:hypothetical protein n=1 Tax=Caproicibacter sp. TaxID=2814884 RepID=UPI00398A081B
MKKKVLALILSVSMVFTVSLPAFAQQKSTSNQNSGIHVLWDNTDVVSVNLNFSGDRADCATYVIGKSGTSKITANVLLKQVTSNGTKTIKTWTGLSASGNEFYFDKSYYVSSGYTYELEIDAKVYRNGTEESIIKTDRDYCG